MKKDNRPMNLNLFKFHFPVMAIVSVIHRITGVIIFLLIPLLLYTLHVSILSQASFSNLQKDLSYSFSKVIILGILVCAVYHLFAGIRHLVMDLGFGESKTAGRITAWFVIFLWIVVVVLLGVWLW